MRRALSVAVLLLGLGACGPVRHATIRSDFEQVDKKTLLRLAVITAPLPADDPQVGAMWSAMARRYANHHRDFIAKEERAESVMPADLCGEGIDGLLHLSPTLSQDGDGVQVEVQGRLLRCKDGVEVWSAASGGSWPSQDPHVSTVIDEYQGEYGSRVTPFIAPSFHALRALLDTLPRPVLEKDEDIMEKIELGE